MNWICALVIFIHKFWRVKCIKLCQFNFRLSSETKYRFNEEIQQSSETALYDPWRPAHFVKCLRCSFLLCICLLVTMTESTTFIFTACRNYFTTFSVRQLLILFWFGTNTFMRSPHWNSIAANVFALICFVISVFSNTLIQCVTYKIVFGVNLYT